MFILFKANSKFSRQVRKEAMKEDMVIQEKLELQATINELIFQVQRQDTQIREMARVVADLGKIQITNTHNLIVTALRRYAYYNYCSQLVS